MTHLTSFTHLASGFNVSLDLAHDGKLRVELTLCDPEGLPWHTIIAFRQHIPSSMEVLVDAVIETMQTAGDQDALVSLFRSSNRWFTMEQEHEIGFDEPNDYIQTAKDHYERVVADGLGLNRY